VEDSTNIQAAYDIWDEDPDKKAVDAVYEKTEDRAIADHFLKQTKKVKTKLPKSVKHVPSVLPAVQVASEGASYNPSMESYLSYAQKIADEEMKMEKQEYHLTKRVQLKAGERYCSQAEIEKEEQSGFWFGGEHENDGDEEDVKQQNVIEVTETISETVQLKPKAKTMKQRKTEINQKITVIKKSKEKLTKKQEQEILNLKSLLKDVRKSEKAHESAVLQQRTKRTIHKLTTTKRLGRGRFEEYLEPVLTSDELTGSLRRLKPQGDLIEERVKSLQKRNIVPIGGDKERRLKKRMREKLVERRDVKEVVKGSRVF
jgi:nucleolar protein 53